MIGGSYGGAIQLATAAVDPRVDALVPLITWNDLAYALAPNNTGARTGVTSDTPGVFKWQWTNGFYLIGEGQPLLNPSLDPSRINSLDCLHFATRACETIRLLNSGRYPADRTEEMLAYARSVSPVSYLDRVKAPTLIVQGQADSLFNLNEATATYRTLKAQGTEAKMIWQSWGHSGGEVPGELDLSQGNLETSHVGQRVLAWFDRYLHQKTGTDTGPAFSYYRDWQSGYGSAAEVPALSRSLYLSGDGKLVDNRSKVARGSRQYTNWLVPTSHSESSIAPLIGLPDPKPYDTRGTYLGWRSEPLAEHLDVVGAPKATLKVVSPKAERVQNSGDASDRLVLFAKVYDVAPDGSRTLVNRLVSPVRVPDVTRPFTVELPGIVHRYEKGHRLEFVIAASDTAYFGNRGVKPVTLVHAPEDTGVLELPVVPVGLTPTTPFTRTAVQHRPPDPAAGHAGTPGAAACTTGGPDGEKRAEGPDHEPQGRIERQRARHGMAHSGAHRGRRGDRARHRVHLREHERGHHQDADPRGDDAPLVRPAGHVPDRPRLRRLPLPPEGQVTSAPGPGRGRSRASTRAPGRSRGPRTAAALRGRAEV